MMLDHCRKLDIPTLVEMANCNAAVVLDGTMDPVREIVAGNDVVYAVWQDLARPQGVGLLLIKGANVVRDMIATEQADHVRVNAIGCTDIYQAEALRRVCGERETLN